MPRMPRLPSRLWYLAAVGVLVLGVAASVYMLTVKLGGLEDALTRVLVPGETALSLSEPGTYTIFHEETGVFDGVVYAGSDISGLRVSVQSAATGKPVDVQALLANVSYSFEGSSAVGIMEFTIDVPGDYVLAAAYEDGRTEPRAILSVAQGFMAARSEPSS